MTLSLSGALAAWQFLALAILVAGAAFASVYFARKHLAAEDGPSEGADGAFWDVFAGLAVVVPAIVLASSTWPWAGLALGMLAAGAALAALAAAPRLLAPAGCPPGQPGDPAQERGGRRTAPERPRPVAAVRTGSGVLD